MKKIMLVGLVLAVGMFGTLRSAYCASGDDPGTQPGKFSIGLVQEYIFDRDMKSVNGRCLSPLGKDGRGIIKYEVQDLGMTLLKVGYQVSNNLNVYAKLGVTDSGGKLNETGNGCWTQGRNNGPIDCVGEYKGDSAFAGGLGLKLSFLLKDNWIIGADAQYLRHENDYSGKRSFRFFDNSGKVVESIKSADCGGSATISEWHVAPFIARDFGKFVPYVGVKYSDMQIEMEGLPDTLNAKNNLGVFAGADFKFNKTFALNLEGRFIDETAMSLAAAFTF